METAQPATGERLTVEPDAVYRGQVLIMFPDQPARKLWPLQNDRSTLRDGARVVLAGLELLSHWVIVNSSRGTGAGNLVVQA